MQLDLRDNECGELTVEDEGRGTADNGQASVRASDNNAKGSRPLGGADSGPFKEELLAKAANNASGRHPRISLMWSRQAWGKASRKMQA